MSLIGKVLEKNWSDERNWPLWSSLSLESFKSVCPIVVFSVYSLSSSLNKLKENMTKYKLLIKSPQHITQQTASGLRGRHTPWVLLQITGGIMHKLTEANMDSKKPLMLRNSIRENTIALEIVASTLTYMKCPEAAYIRSLKNTLTNRIAQLLLIYD